MNWTTVGVAALAAFVLSWLYGPREGGLWIPKHHPDEVNRICHETGFSIVRPPDWIAWEQDEDTVVITPGCKRMRYHPQIRVTRLTHPPKMDEFSKATLGPYQAHKKIDAQIGGSDYPYFSCEYVVTCSQAWFQIVYLTPNGTWGKPMFNDVPIEVARYLDTFRYNTTAME